MINKTIENNKANWFFNASFVLFVFHLINREFYFGFDIRYLSLFFAAVSIYLNRSGVQKLINNFGNVMILFYYLVSILSVIYLINSSVFSNDIFPTTKSVVILYIYCLVFLVNFLINRDKINLKKIHKTVFISMIINLVIVFILIYQINNNSNLKEYVMPFSSIRGFIFGKNHYNFFGGNFRVAGFSEDANYLSLNSIILIVLSIWNFKKNPNSRRFITYSSILIGVILLGLSASKTISFGFLFSILMVYMFKITKRVNFGVIIPILVIISVASAIILKEVNLGESMTNRFYLWRNALELFSKNPILGSGISSFRHFSLQSGWVVHTHSLYMQNLAELGLVGVFMLTVIFANQYNSLKDNYSKVLAVTFIIASLSLDFSYTDYFVFFVVLIPIIDKNMNKENDPTIKVALLSNGLSNGGAERMVYDLASKVSEDKNFKIDLLLTDPADPENMFENQFLADDENFNVIQIASKKHDFVRNNFKILRYLIANQPDIVHTHQITLAYCFLPYLLGNNPAKVHTVHNDSHKEFGSKAFRIIYHIAFVFFRINVVSISEYILKTSKKEYFLLNDSLHSMVYNGRKISSLNFEKKKSTMFNIIMVGRLTDVKNHIDAIKMMDKIVNEKEIKDIRLSIFGEGPLKEYLESEINSKKLNNNVILSGIVPDVTEYLVDSDLFIMTSLHEGFPISAIEALTVGLPIVLSNFGSAEELIHENGFLVRINDISGFTNAVLSIYEDNELRISFGMKSVELSLQFSLENMINDYKKLYCRVKI